jgi:hypothetical protein
MFFPITIYTYLHQWRLQNYNNQILNLGKNDPIILELLVYSSYKHDKGHIEIKTYLEQEWKVWRCFEWEKES